MPLLQLIATKNLTDPKGFSLKLSVLAMPEDMQMVVLGDLPKAGLQAWLGWHA
jgi:hypothetical protein